MSQSKVVRASFEIFASTGSLGGIALEDPRWDVRSRCGIPTDWGGGTSLGRATIWKFGDIELHFDADDRVSLIHCDDFADTPRGGGGLMIDPWVIRAGLPLGTLARALYDADIDFTCRPDPDNPGWVELLTPAQVRFCVAVSPGEYDNKCPVVSCGRMSDVRHDA